MIEFDTLRLRFIYEFYCRFFLLLHCVGGFVRGEGIVGGVGVAGQEFFRCLRRKLEFRERCGYGKLHYSSGSCRSCQEEQAEPTFRCLDLPCCV